MFVMIENLKYQYNKSTKAIIQNFSLKIKKGEIISILGESGSGKSTILRLLAGLETPNSGSISINDNVIVNHHHFLPPEKREVGIVFQDYALFPHMTVERNIKYGLRKMSRIQKQQRLDEMLQLVRLEDYKNRYPYELSGGQQQRVALARALAPAPSLLLFDEPFSNLDAHLQIKIRNELREILKHTNTTSIFVTHDQTDAVALADRIILLENGSIGNELKPSELASTNYMLQYRTGLRI
ncbi:ATP-binding cassette domain-containing protein [Aquibacillus halophilus]|uniref:Carnitine transport ATP-binding protein OpuCA n=1 Tax=Aquibacillus halophilus TaxID=930132 RepID=A0A6A8DCM7_9BACI|nr:ABC transporter ATP-binding protein [Aquibacillus halophilus]MRH41541.1 ATP-binding cassette domain-containing protein [Aquibacillus halophilus]